MRARIINASVAIAAGTSVIAATCETIGATTAISIPQPVRLWMVGFIIAGIILIATCAVLDRLDRIEDRVEHLAVAGNPRQRAKADYEDIQRRLRDNGDGVTYLYPKEQEE